MTSTTILRTRWEYACRAGTTTRFSNGDTLPDEFIKNPDNSWYPCPDRGHGREEVMPLHVGKTSPNPWGLYDMHGNVEEWCHDWYGPYVGGDRIDPVGRVDGDFKVSRGGSHSTVAYYQRCANRMGTVPEDKSFMIGFGVVIGEMSDTAPLPTVTFVPTVAEIPNPGFYNLTFTWYRTCARSRACTCRPD